MIVYQGPFDVYAFLASVLLKAKGAGTNRGMLDCC
jgi:hypothetical protein